MTTQTHDFGTFVVVDDGTLDTILECTICGREERFNPEVETASEGNSDGGEPYTDDELDLMRIRQAVSFAEAEHECS